jgi:hypothetical protein
MRTNHFLTFALWSQNQAASNRAWWAVILVYAAQLKGPGRAQLKEPTTWKDKLVFVVSR